MANLAANFDGVLGASIVLNGSVAGPLLGVFLLGLLVPFANKWVCTYKFYIFTDLKLCLCMTPMIKHCNQLSYRGRL